MDRDEHIRQLAYFLWLEAGCPEGRAEEFWARAEAMETEPAVNEYLQAVEDGSF